VELRDPAGTPVLSRTLDITLGETARTQTIQWDCPDEALPGTYTAFATTTDSYDEQQRTSANIYVTSAPGIDTFDIYLPLVVRSTP
ncbi:MAG: hypothetical protein ACLFTI_10915, partial [Anaerolineales bacterium]